MARSLSSTLIGRTLYRSVMKEIRFCHCSFISLFAQHQLLTNTIFWNCVAAILLILSETFRALNADGTPFFLVEKFDPRQRGWRWIPGGRLRSLPTQRDVLFSILPPCVQEAIKGKDHADSDTLDDKAPLHHPWLPKEEACKEGVTGEQLRGVARTIFRARADAIQEDAHRFQEDAFLILREIGKQRQRQACSSTNVINGLKVCS